ncbi:MAG TPA: C4-dicarboxylate transporter DctA [Steroidobacteraceae bacterium]|nr:C4-dicarboxylate transporter DctA [Steroidobacteraceae bacterium]
MRYFPKNLYVWVLIAILMGGAVGYFTPHVAVILKPLGDGFVSLIRMLVAPVIFITVVLGIAGAADIKKAGRVGIKSLLYFEVVSTFALVLGLLAVHLLRPGSGFNVDPASLDSKATAVYVSQAQSQDVAQFVLHIIPKSFADAFTGSGDLLQVVLVAVLFGLALARAGRAGSPVVGFLESLSAVFFGMVSLIMRLAPLGAGAAMAFTIGKYGVASLGPLLKLLGTFYLACGLFVCGILGIIARLAGFSIFNLLRYLREELLLVLGTSSSESALVPLMQKLERLGCSRSVVGLVVPSGYSFNLDGTNIYLTIAALFIAQALNVPLTVSQEATLLGVAMLTSKGASGVTGAGFVTLAATLTVVPSVPVAGLALILGIDRFMSEARALTNMIGNAVATIVVARWEGELDFGRLNSELEDERARVREPAASRKDAADQPATG